MSLNDLYIQNNAIDSFVDLNDALAQTNIQSDEGRPAISNLMLTPSGILDLDQNTQVDFDITLADNSDGFIEMQGQENV